MAYNRSQTVALRSDSNQIEEQALTSCRNIPNVLRMTTNAIREMAQSTALIFNDFQGAMKTILPKLDAEEKKLVYLVFGEYHLLLLVTQRFLTRTTILVSRAQTTSDLLKSFDSRTVVELIDRVVPLLQEFWALKALIDDKVKDERTILFWRNISFGILGLGAAVLVIGTGVGIAVGFTAVVKSTLLISGAVTIVGISSAAIAHAAQKLSVFEQVINNLKEIGNNLTKLSQNYTIIDAMGGILLTEANLKSEFLLILSKTQEEVNKGFEILKQM